MSHKLSKKAAAELIQTATDTIEVVVRHGTIAQAIEGLEEIQVYLTQALRCLKDDLETQKGSK